MAASWDEGQFQAAASAGLVLCPSCILSMLTGPYEQHEPAHGRSQPLRASVSGHSPAAVSLPSPCSMGLLPRGLFWNGSDHFTCCVGRGPPRNFPDCVWGL